MISIKQMSGLAAVSLLFASCAPFPPGNGGQQPPIDPKRVPVAPKVLTPAEEANANAAAERKRIRDQKRRDAAAAAKTKVNDPTLPNVVDGDTTVPKPPSPTTNKPKYRTAVKIPGKSGFVYNPWTNKAVDVRGIPSGELVRDPQDSNPDHKFRVP
ncbi:MAG: hypothetical protein QNL33_11145 [Akkermansiaceae bacterium]|jgi:hypothetical protein